MKKLTLTALAVLMTAPSFAADMGRRRSYTADDVGVRLVAAEYTTARMAARVCRVSDGVAVNYPYFQAKLAQIGGRNAEKDKIFKNEVAATKSRVATEVAALGVGEWCDNYLDGQAEDHDGNIGQGPSTAVVWDDPSGLFGGPGMGAADPFADFGDGL